MKISHREKSNFQIFDIDGNIAFEETQDLEDFVYRNISTSFKNIAINLLSVPYLNSSALGSFVRILQTLKSQSMELFIMNINEDIENLFKITGVTKYFKFVKEEDIK